MDAYGSNHTIKVITGVTPQTFRFEDNNNQTPEEQLDKLLDTWREKVTSHIDARLREHVEEDDDRRKAVDDICERKVSDLVALARQMGTGDIVNTTEFAVHILNSSEALQHLSAELNAIRKRRLNAFLSSIAEEDEEND